MYEFCMPYMIQLVSELKTRVEVVHKKNEEREKKDEQQAKEKMNQPLDFVAHDLEMMMPGSQPMLTGPGMYNTTNPNMGGGGGFGNSQTGGPGGNPYGTNYRGF